MKVLPVKKYNNRGLIEYDKAVEKWDWNNGGFPCVAMFQFYKNNGSERKTGYVAFSDHKAIWRQSKKEATEAFNKYYC